MNKYNFETIPNRKGKSTIKWDAKHINARFHTNLKENDEYYPMFIADLDFQLPDEVLEHMHSKYLVPDFGYFDIPDSFYDAIINWHHLKHQCDLEKEWIVPTCGTVTSLHILSNIYGKDKNFLIFTPVYRQFKACTDMGKMFTSPLIYRERQYDIDFDDLENKLKHDKIDVIIFCNPHNPGGRSWTYDELLRLVNLCKEYNVLLISDEIHADICLSERNFISLMNFSDIYDNIVVATSPNKTFSISGLSTSYILCRNPKIRKTYVDYVNAMHLSPNRVGIEMIEMVYRYGQEWHSEMQKVVKANVEEVIDCLEPLGIEVMVPDSGYLVWIKVNDKVDVDKFIEELAINESVLLETGSRFIDDYDGFIRINVGTSPRIVKEAMKRLAKLYRKYIEV